MRLPKPARLPRSGSTGALPPAPVKCGRLFGVRGPATANAGVALAAPARQMKMMTAVDVVK